MTKPANSNPLNQPDRCQHITPKHRRCRLPVVNSRVGLCFRHLAQLAAKGAVLPHSPDPSDLRSALAGELREFKTAAEINLFLGRLLLLLSEGRVAPRRAAVLAYVCNLLLRTLPALDRELHPGDPDAPGFEPPRLDFGDLFKPSPTLLPDSPPPSESRAFGAL